MRKIITFVLAIAICLTVCACGQDTATTGQTNNADVSATEVAGEPKKIIIAHSFGETNMLNTGVNKFGELLSEKSGGTIVAEIYANGALGSDAEMLQQLRLGSIDCQPISLPFVSGEYPQCGIDQLPFLFSSAEEAFAAYDGELGQAIQDEVFSKMGIQSIGKVMGQGFREFTNNVRPIVEPSDMKGIKFRTTESAVRIAMFEACGASVISMSLGELFTSLQNGAVDGQENPLATIDSNGFYEVQKYLTLSDHIFVENFMVMNADKWNSFTAEEQEIIREAWNEAVDFERGLLEDSNEAYLSKFEEAGMEINEMNKDAFIEAVAPVWDSYIDEFGDEWINLARKYAE